MSRSDNDADKCLGMQAKITRRDFLNGAGLAVGATIVPPGSAALAAALPANAQDGGSYYPPQLTGLRGSHPGSFELAHQIRDGAALEAHGEPESYDLVVVGGGISGLSAAFFYQQQMGADARILVLDNHDDFGGHAKRNEFHVDGHHLIGYGGTQSIEAPGGYPKAAKQLLEVLGIKTERFYQAFDQSFKARHALQDAAFFGADGAWPAAMVPGPYWSLSEEFLSRTPLSEQARAQLAALRDFDQDPTAELPQAARLELLEKQSYRDYLARHVGMGQEALAFMQFWSSSLWAVGIDALPALGAWSSGYPGFNAVELPLDAYHDEDDEPYIFHFPDGNASIARLLVRKMIPGVSGGTTMEDIVTSRFDYARLDDPASSVRIRLNSTVTRVRPGASGEYTSVCYGRHGRIESVSAKHCVLACYHAIIPHLCPELPSGQKVALTAALRAPLVYTNVAIRNWRSFAKLGVSRIYCPGGFHHDVGLDFPVSLGDYKFAASPDQPTVLHLTRIPGAPGETAEAQFRAGKHELLAMPFETFERETRRQLGQVLGAGGFDPARDIAAITVNRWPHGYAYGFDQTTRRVAFEFDHWALERRTWETASKRFGSIAIANSDAAADAMTESAIEQAHRAVRELLGQCVSS